MNDALAHGRYFFIDIAKDGIALYQSDDTELHQQDARAGAGDGAEKNYRITREELEWLGRQSEELGGVVREVCSERLEALRGKTL